MSKTQKGPVDSLNLFLQAENSKKNQGGTL